MVLAPRLASPTQAYYAIREFILRGKLSIRAVLSRRQLAADLGMSMLPIAESAQRLETDGLLESKPQVGTGSGFPRSSTCGTGSSSERLCSVRRCCLPA